MLSDQSSLNGVKLRGGKGKARAASAGAASSRAALRRKVKPKHELTIQEELRTYATGAPFSPHRLLPALAR
jgi:hypothetical protein